MIAPLLGALGSLLGASGADPLDMQKKHSEEMLRKTTLASMQKSEIDTKNGIAAGILDSQSKASSASFSAAKSLSY